MESIQQLPKITDLQSLSGAVGSYPISGLGIVQTAEHLGYDEEVISFVRMFSKRIVFNSRSDFVEHCRLLERLLRQERQSPPEYLKGP